MPTYDYVCDACRHQFEHFQSMSEPVKRKCPEVRQVEAAAADRSRGGDRLQGLGLLSDRLSQRGV